MRVIAATNRELPQAVAQGDFRGDLFFRLNVFPIRVPPLRERSDDVVLLAETFAQRFALQMGRRIAPCQARLSSCSRPMPGPATSASCRTP